MPATITIDGETLVVEVVERGPAGRDGAATLPAGLPGQVLGYDENSDPVAMAPQIPLQTANW